MASSGLNFSCLLWEVSAGSVWTGTYQDFHVRIASPHLLHHLGVRRYDLGRGVLLRHVVGAEHELHDVWFRGGQPPDEVVVRDVDGQVARVALVVVVPVGVFRNAVLRVVRLRAHELDLAGHARGHEPVPEQRPPAGDLRDGVAEGHCGVLVSLDDGKDGELWGMRKAY